MPVGHSDLYRLVTCAEMLTVLFIVCFVTSLSAYHTKGGRSGSGSGQLPLVQTAQGLLRGSFLTTYTGTRFYSFRRVRFAEPPTGENRFKPPVPVKQWQGEYDATEDGPICPQPFGDSIGPISEDCLFLNVYTKKLTGKQPVIVFFHPGGYLQWTGRSTLFGPQYIMNKDIVLVTTNYRLGALGFLSTEDRILRGNYGMKDQVAALRWVKQNIAKFGGDPDNVTIMGCSAGAASVELHMLSPMSRGLFHKAIAMSGAATGGVSVNQNPMYLAQELTKLMGCGETKTSQQVYNCVKSADGQLMANRSDGIRLWKDSPAVLFAPVVEGDYGDGEERFLTDKPIELLKRGEVNSVPLMSGTTADEIAFYAYYLDDSRIQEFNENFNQLAPKLLLYERDGPTSLKITQELKKFYLNNQPISNATRKGLSEVFADAHIIFPQTQSAKLFAEKSTQPVYMYLFSYVGRYSFSYYPGTTTPIGAAHVDDLMYIMYISQYFSQYNTTDPEVNIINTLTSTWTEFARTGVPALPETNTKWSPMSSQNLQYLDIGNDPKIHPVAGVSLKMVPGVPFPERMRLFETLFPLSGPHQILY